MSPDQLTQAESPSIQSAVLAVVTGLSIADAAHQYRMDAVALSHAVKVYDQAGREALDRHSATTDWWQAYLRFTDWENADATFATHVLPLLRDTEATNAIDGWWYTRKHPCWRLRLRVRPTIGAKLTVGDGLDRLVADGQLQRWWPGIYEPETTAFGGAAGMTAAHALFITDSREAQRLRQLRDLAVGARELSVLLCTLMMRAAKLEWYEQGDVWHHVITEEHRSAINDVPTASLDSRAREIRPPAPRRQRHPAAPRRTAGARRRVGHRLPRRGAGTRPCRPGRNPRPQAATGAQLPRDLPLEPPRTVHAGTEHLGLGGQGSNPPHRGRGVTDCGRNAWRGH